MRHVAKRHAAWRRRTKRSGLAGMAAAAIGLAAGPAMAQDALRIGALMPLTGGLQAYGESSLNGVKLAVDQINQTGGVLGQPVTLSVGDTQTAAQSGVDAAQKLVSVEGVNGIVGALSSGVTVPVAKSVTSVHRIPQISSASTAPVISVLEDKDFLFRTVPSDAFQGVALADVTTREGLKRISVIYVNNDYGKGLAESFDQAFVRQGGTVAAMTAYEPKQASYRGELRTLSQGSPEALLLIGYPEDGIPILKQALEGGHFTRFVFSDGMKAPEIIETLGARYLNGSFGTAPQPPSDSPAAKAFASAYEAAYGKLPPKPYIDSAYDATYLLALAAEAAGSTDPVKIRDALRGVATPPGETVMPGEFAKAKVLLKEGKEIDYVGAAGEQNFDSNGDVAGTFAHWAIKDGEIVTVRVFTPDE